MTRIVFLKTGFAKYISHLDLNRCMSRLIARAEIPIWYTQGFNPHPYMVFSAALPIGVCGENELLDIKLVTQTDYNEMLSRMNDKAPNGISFKEIYESDNDFKYIEKAVYRICVPDENTSLFRQFLSYPEINVIKKTKSREITVDLKKEITTEEICSENGFTVFKAIAPCGNEKNVSPTLLTDTFNEKASAKCIFNITRVAFLDKDSNIFR